MIRRTLMQLNWELVDFEIDQVTGEARVIDVSEAGIDLIDSMGYIQRDSHSALTELVNGHAVDSLRSDAQDILEPFGAASPVHLVLMGHGLSLSDQYWYRAPGSTERWEDINFFENGWEPGFGEGGGVPLDIVERYGRPCSTSPLVLEADDMLVDGVRLCAIAGTQGDRSQEDRGHLTPERCQTRIETYTALGISDASAHVAKVACLSCLAQLANFHSGNFGAICKVSSGAWRAAPIFDYGGSFGFFHGKNKLLEETFGLSTAKLLCASKFSFLDPSWDWSWYDPRALDGFEDHIVEAYAPYQDLAPHFAGFVASVFAMQQKYVNRIASGERA